MQKVMTTSQQQTSVNGADEWTCSLAAFRASLSVMPGDEEARKMTATSGRQCIVPSMKSSPLGLWLKTLLESSRWSSRARFLRWQAQPLFSTRLTTFEDNTNCERPLPCNASAQTLKVTDMPSSRCLFRLVPSEPPTDETGCSSSQGAMMPTPNASDCFHQNKSNDHDLKKGYLRGVAVDMWEKGELNQSSLVQPDEYMAKLRMLKAVNGETMQDTVERLRKDNLLPTPTAIEGVKWTNTWNPNSQMGQSLSAMAGSGMLPTPIATDISHKQRVENLKAAGGQTMASRANGANRPNGLSDFIHFYEVTKQEADAGKTSRLSPLFTEEMMGFPLMWTALPFLSESGAPKPSKPTATPSSPK